MMRKIYLILFLIFSIGFRAQNRQVLYNFSTLPQSSLLNPAVDSKYKFFIGLPVFSGVSAYIGSSGVSAYDLFAKNNIDFNQKVSTALSSVSNKDFFTANQQLEILTGGFRIKDKNGDNRDKYITFGVYQDFSAIVYVPKDLIEWALYGNLKYLGKTYSFSDVKLKADLMSVYHLGLQKRLNNKWIVGGRGKLYSSIVSAKSTNNQGTYSTILSDKTIYEQFVSLDLVLNTSGIKPFSNENADAANIYKKKVLLGGDLGFGFDAGFTFYPKKNVQITASLLDIGAINHTKGIENYTVKGNYLLNGAEIINGVISPSPKNELKNNIKADSTFTSFSTFLPVKLNSSYQYSFEEERPDDGCPCAPDLNSYYRNDTGVQLFAMTTPGMPLVALTGFFKRRIYRSFQTKVTYTVDSYSYSNVGLGISARVNKLNFYLMGDNLLAYRDMSKSQTFSVQFGINLIFKDKNDND